MERLATKKVTMSHSTTREAMRVRVMMRVRVRVSKSESKRAGEI